MELCKEEAKTYGAERLYLCAWSAEDTIAFYKSMGCVPPEEVNQKLFEEDKNNIQLELNLMI